jgi:hypothetical protein
MDASELFREAVHSLLAELEGARLDVVLIPAPEPRHSGHCIRVAAEYNADWYRELCAEYQSSRRRNRLNDNDTRIKRKDTIRALERALAGHFESAYVDRLMPFIRERMKEMRGGGATVMPNRSEAPRTRKQLESSLQSGV